MAHVYASRPIRNGRDNAIPPRSSEPGLDPKPVANKPPPKCTKRPNVYLHVTTEKPSNLNLQDHHQQNHTTLRSSQRSFSATSPQPPPDHITLANTKISSHPNPNLTRQPSLGFAHCTTVHGRTRRQKQIDRMNPKNEGGKNRGHPSHPPQFSQITTPNAITRPECTRRGQIGRAHV